MNRKEIKLRLMKIKLMIEENIEWLEDEIIKIRGRM